VAGIAQAALGSEKINWNAFSDDYSRIRDEIESVIPGFKGYNQRIEQGRGFHLQNLAAERIWDTPSRKACFSDDPLPPCRDEVSEDILTLQTLRSHDQYNTSIYGMDDRYRGISGERRVLFMNEADIENLGLSDGDKVTISTVSNDGINRNVSGFKVVNYQIPKGCIAAYYPETNPLVPLESVAEDCGTPTYKSINVRVTVE
jgi:anaerobic selenocysteine-containing dehydrogenase